MRTALTAGIITAALVGCAGAGDLTGGAAHSGSLVDAREYSEVDFGRIGLLGSVETESTEGAVAVGDVARDGGLELVVGNGGGVSVLNPFSLETLRSVVFEESRFRVSRLADVDQDGKEDILLGGAEGGSARIRVLNGEGETLADSAFENIFRAQTQIQFSDGSRIYFTAQSELAVAPKVVGLLDLSAGDDPQWLHHMGPVPRGISQGSDGRLALSHRAASREREDVATAYESDRTRHALYLLNANGETAVYEPFGPEIREGYPREGQISGVRSKLFDLDDDGRDEVLMAVERVSEIYGGAAEFRVLSADGELLSMYEGPEQTDVAFGFYRRETDSAATAADARIVLAWTRAGRVTVLDGEGARMAERRLPGDIHYARLRGIADFTGDGNVEYIITDHTRLFVLNEELETLFSFAAPLRIESVAQFADEEDRLHMAVRADRLYLLGPKDAREGGVLLYSNPPGARFTLDGRELDPEELPLVHRLAEGSYSVRAEIDGREPVQRELTVRAGRTTEYLFEPPAAGAVSSAAAAGAEAPPIRLSEGIPDTALSSYDDLSRRAHTTVPESFSRSAPIANYAGDAAGDVALVDRSSGSVQVLDEELQLQVQGRFRSPRPALRPSLDVSADGAAELWLGDLGFNEVYSARVTAGDGRILLDKALTPGFDTRTRFMGSLDGTLWIDLFTGYLLSPRMIYGLEHETGSVEFAAPTAPKVTNMVPFAERVYVGSFTVSNGASVVLEDGTEHVDTEVSLNVLSPEGERLPTTTVLPQEDRDGWSRLFTFDGNGDGEEELYALNDKDPQYYPGTVRFYRIRPGEGLEEVYAGRQDSRVRPVVLPAPGGDYLMLHYRNLNRLDILDGNFNVLASHKEDAGLLMPINLDGDDVWEIASIADGNLRVERIAEPEFARIPLRTLSMRDGDIRRFDVADIDRDGKAELLLVGEGSLELWGY